MEGVVETTGDEFCLLFPPSFRKITGHKRIQRSARCEALGILLPEIPSQLPLIALRERAVFEPTKPSDRPSDQ